MKKNITFHYGTSGASLDAAGRKFTHNGTTFSLVCDNTFTLEGTEAYVPMLDTDLAFKTEDTFMTDLSLVLHPRCINLLNTTKASEATRLAVLGPRLKLNHFTPVPTWITYNSDYASSGTAYEWLTNSTQVVVKDNRSARGLGQLYIDKTEFTEVGLRRDLDDLSAEDLLNKYSITGGTHYAQKLKQGDFVIQEVLNKVAEYRLMISPAGAIYGYERSLVSKFDGTVIQAKGTDVQTSDIVPLTELDLPKELMSEIQKMMLTLFPNLHGSMDLVLHVLDKKLPVSGGNLKWSVFEYGHQFGTNLKGGGTWFRDFMRQCIYEYAELKGL